MKKVVLTQAAEIKRLRNKFRRLKRFVWPLVQNFRLYVKEQKKSKKKKSKFHKSTKKVSNLKGVSRSHHLSNWGGIRMII